MHDIFDFGGEKVDGIYVRDVLVCLTPFNHHCSRNFLMEHTEELVWVCCVCATHMAGCGKDRLWFTTNLNIRQDG